MGLMDGRKGGLYPMQMFLRLKEGIKNTVVSKEFKLKKVKNILKATLKVKLNYWVC